MTYHTCLRCSLALGLAALVTGCAGRPSILPNPDKSLQKSSAQFAADAAKRHPYPADAPRGGEATGRAQVGYTLDRLEIANLSDMDWQDVEVWVNQKYVVFVPIIPKKPGRTSLMNFQMLFDDAGNSMPTDSTKERVEKVEILVDGKMYDVKTQLAD